ncbi:branched-chain amino acid transport system ATP-binding protein [Thermocatellispora tengchongensis]|uniref:Branched-chain amino acid transport system ATP-binding protein n=1 Tax=Thermocatellispora tengchongensis TaxID=1073253 RepID=A0A840PAL5_9ACTN|nr:ABC transporter ATP-binding protein [Thermocatellispora tengchongensis]MBB5136049.1 branched-chain amino acid transport system ATP-binding protein [Thermocatellispora tengchongensis]
MSLLTVENLCAGYGGLRVLFDVSFGVEEGNITVILGANGAGKSTLLRALSGMIPATGTATLEGRRVVGRGRHRSAARLGIGHVPEGRGTFGSLTVEENLRAGGYHRPRSEVESSLEGWYEFFPRLGERRRQLASGLSGGEQQMLAIARALMGKPRLLLLDEPSLGLSPKLTGTLFTSLRAIKERLDMTILLVEQNAHLSLEIADDALVMSAGRLGPKQSAAELRQDQQIQRAYLGA